MKDIFNIPHYILEADDDVQKVYHNVADM